MKLIEVLQLIEEVAYENKLSRPFICGGLPRDKVINKDIILNDIDITTGDSDVHFLAKEVHLKLKKINAKYLVMSDGHASIMLPGLKLDFSSNFIVPNIQNIIGIKMPDLHQEMISRDFTCNTLLMSLDLKNIYDPLKKGIHAIESKTIDTCLPPNMTLKLDPNRIVRSIYLSSKLNFKLSDRVEDWISQNKHMLDLIPKDYISKKINKALEFDYNNTINLIKKLKIQDKIPLNYINFKDTL